MRIKFYNYIICLGLYLTILLVPNGLIAQCNGLSISSSNSSGCTPLVSKFNIAGGVPAGTMIMWDFGNGFIPGADTITRIFTLPGIQNITATLQLPSGSNCTLSANVNVIPSPMPIISASPSTSLCGTRTVILTDNSPNIVSREWVIDGVTYLNQASVTHTFSSGGSKNVSLKVTNNIGCVGVFSRVGYITVLDSLPVEICANVEVNASNARVVYTPRIKNLGNRAVSSYQWNFPGGSITTSNFQKPPPVNYSNIENGYDVSLTITTSDGCIFTKKYTKFITNFLDIPKDPICAQNWISIRNLANNNGRKAIDWFGVGLEIDPEATTKSAARLRSPKAGKIDFEAEYFYSDDKTCGVRVKYPQSINVTGPSADFEVPKKTSCNKNDSFLVENKSLPEGAPTVTYTWYVFDKNDKLIEGQIFGPSPNKVDTFFKFQETGQYGLALVAKSAIGCIDSIFRSKIIEVIRPNFVIEMDTFAGCLGTSISMRAKNDPPIDLQNAKYTWKVEKADDPRVFMGGIGASNSFKANLPGRYNVYLYTETSSECKDTVVRKNLFEITGVKTEVNYNIDNGCVTLQVPFEGVVKDVYPPTNPNNLKIQWYTEPEEGAFIADENNLNTDIFFFKSGCYDVYFSVEHPQNCFSQTILKEAVCVGTVPRFYVPSLCIGDTVNVANETDTTNVRFKWIADNPNVQIFPNDSAYNIKLLAADTLCFNLSLVAYKGRGYFECRDTLTRLLCPNLPFPDFSFSDTEFFCAPAIVGFFADTIKNGTYIWTFGDGESVVTDTNAYTKVYLNNKNNGFDVTLKVIDQNGCSNSISKIGSLIIRGPEPDLVLSANKACDSITIQIINFSKEVPLGTQLFYNDGTEPVFSRPGDTLYHTFKIPTLAKDSVVYNMVLLADDLAGDCRGFKEFPITLYRKSRARFLASNTLGCIPFEVNFASTSSSATEILWDFNNDGIIDDSTENPTFTYDTAGVYTVKLITNNGAGCSDTFIQENLIRANLPPDPNFVLKENFGCAFKDIIFENNSINVDFAILHYGDGTAPDTNRFTTHRYLYNSSSKQDSVVFYPFLVGFNGENCTDTVFDTVVVYKPLEVSFLVDTQYGCSPLTVNYTYTGDSATLINWDFNNDGFFDDTGVNVSTIYNVGQYSPKVYVKSKFGGCTNELKLTNLINVLSAPEAKFSILGNNNCSGDTLRVMFEAYSNTLIDSALLSVIYLEDTSIVEQTNLDNISIFGDKTPPGRYIAQLEIENIFGCRNSLISDTFSIVGKKEISTHISFVSVNLDGTVALSWNPLGFDSTDISEIYKKENLDSVLLIRSRLAVQNIIDTAAKDETSTKTITYFSRSIDKCNNINDSERTHTTMLLNVDKDGFNTLKLSWNAYVGWDSISYYVVFRSINGIDFSSIDTLYSTSSFLTILDSNLCDNPYYYRIKAFSRDTNIYSFSNLSSGVPDYFYSSLAPEINYVTTENNIILVNWSKGFQSNIAAYIIDRKVGNNTDWDNNYSFTSSTSFIDSLANPQKDINNYRIRTIDGCGKESSLSNPSQNILLNSEINKDNRTVFNWNLYSYWKSGILNQKLQKRNKNGVFETIATLSSTTNNFIEEDLVFQNPDSIDCYRLIAYEAEINGDISISNIVCHNLPPLIYIPNAFTPNNDTLNDVWKVSFLGIFNNQKNQRIEGRIEIFNRWGAKVFETGNLNEGWDGRFKGEEVPEGIYIYYIVAKAINNKNIEKTGNIFLYR